MFQRGGTSEARFWKGSFVVTVRASVFCGTLWGGDLKKNKIKRRKWELYNQLINNLDGFVNKRTFKFITEPSLDPTQISPSHLANEVSAWRKISALTPILPEVYRHQSVPKIAPRLLEEHNRWGAFQVHVYNKHKVKLGLEASFCSCVSAKC